MSKKVFGRTRFHATHAVETVATSSTRSFVAFVLPWNGAVLLVRWLFK
jgi:hypothetical protein